MNTSGVLVNNIFFIKKAGKLALGVMALSVLLHTNATPVYADDDVLPDPAFIAPPSPNPITAPAPKNNDAIINSDAVYEPPRTEINYVQRSDESQLILEFMVDDIVLDPGMLVYVEDDDVLVPLSILTDLLEFQIDVDTARGVAKGWFINQQNTFHLETPYNHIMLKGEKQNINGIVETHIDDIYVDIGTLMKWFPIELTLNYNELRLYIKTLVDLPFQARAKRRARWDRTKLNQSNTGVKSPEDIITLPHRMLAAPAIEINHSLNYANTQNSSLTQTGHSLNAQGDFLRMDTRLGMIYQTSTSGREELDNIRLNMSKEDYQGTLLGPLQATRFEMGDISSAAPFPLAGGGGGGRGITFENTPYNFVRDPDNFVVEGFAPVGWDVEVYQDQRLLDFQTVGSDGRYAFDALALREGFNLFRIVIYGPNGEKEERFERFFLGRGMVDKGKFLYQVNMLESSTPLFDVSANPAQDTPHTLSILGEYGLTEYLSLSGGYYYGPTGNTVLDGVGFGLRASGERTFSQINTFWNNDGARSTSFDVRGNLTQNLSFGAGHVLHLDYQPGIRSTREESYIQASQLFNFMNLKTSSMTFEIRQETDELGTEETRYINRLSTGFKGISLTNLLDYTKFETLGGNEFTGEMTLRQRTRFGTLRGRLDYDMTDGFELTSADLQYQADINRDFSVNALLSTQLGDNKLTTIGAGLDWRLEKYRLSFNTSVTDDKDFQAGVNLAYNLVPRSLYGNYMMTGRTDDINSGRLLLRPYIDSNQNGIFDEDEKELEDVQFRNLLRGTRSKEDESGLPVLSGLTPNLVNKVMMMPETLPDIYMVPAKDALHVMGKRGVNGPLDYPVLQLGEISGMLYAIDETGKEIALSGVEIVLLDSNGQEVTYAYSEYDGYFSFPSLKMGTYELFFPYSDTLDDYYQGDGEGPTITLTAEQPEQRGFDLITLPQHIRLKENVDEKDLQSALEPKKNMRFQEFRFGLFTPVTAP